MPSGSNILTSALELPENERAEIALELLISLQSDQISTTDEEILSEADRRESAMDADPRLEISHQDLLKGLGRG